MGGFEGTTAPQSVRSLIEKYHIGGVIYFARNVASLEQVAALSNEVQQMAASAGELPLWISIDQEGGMVARITEGVALMPGNMALAAGSSEESVYEAAHISGQELRTLGINLNFAPVLDVNNNPRNPVIGVRSYGESPEAVGRYGAAAIRGYQEANVVATAKHFPGHGDTDVDSHLDLPTISHYKDRIYAVELKPFVKAIEAGVDSIMSSHIYFPAFEKLKLPSTLSRSVLTGLLREELGFEGVIMTDCMEMHAISRHYGTVEASVLAIEAGADLVLISHSFDLQVAAIEAILQAVRAGRISADRIDQSVRRLIALKERRGLLAARSGAAGSAGLAVVGCAAHRAAAQRMSEASVTLVKDTAALLPLSPEPTLVLAVEPAIVSEVDEAYASRATLGSSLAAHGIAVTEHCLPLQQVGEYAAEALRLAANFEQIVVGTYNANLYTEQAKLVNDLLAMGKNPIVVALRNPYDIQCFSNISTYVCLYESRALALHSAAKFLTGRIQAAGKLPVSITDDPIIEAGVTKL